MVVACRWPPTLTNLLRSLRLRLGDLAPASSGEAFAWMMGPAAVLVIMQAPARVVSAISCSPCVCAAGGVDGGLNCVAVWFLLALALDPLILVL